MNPAEVLERLGQRRPSALRLATLACLAPRVEPHLLRALRQEFLADSAPGTELDLWHSRLVAARGADAFSFDAKVLQALRERLAGEPASLREAVLALTLKCYRHHPDLVELETRLNAAPVLDPRVGDAAIEEILETALARLRSDDASAQEVARWLLQAAPRFHQRVLRAGATWSALLRGSALLGGRRLVLQAAPTDIAPETLALAQPPHPTFATLRQVGVALAGGRLTFRQAELAGAKIAVPAIAPSMVSVRTDTGRFWSVEAAPGVSLDVGGAVAVEVHTLAGDRFRLEATRQARAGSGPIAAQSTPLRMQVRAQAGRSLVYEISERNATESSSGTEIRAHAALAPMLGDLVASASNDGTRDTQIRSTLHQLLVPMEIDHVLVSGSELLLDADPVAACIPWELVAGSGVDAGNVGRPWAITSRLVRATSPVPESTLPGSPDSALVIGEPLLDAGWPLLPGARTEAEAVVAQLSVGPGQLPRSGVRALFGENARSIVQALFEQAYRIVHVTGHCGGKAGEEGVVLSDNAQLGAAEFQAMRAVPELVFVSCGHQSTFTTHRGYDRAGFASRFARSLTAIGVRCVVMAGWVVEDEPAAQFAGTFYEALLAGDRFADAVAAAREAAWRLSPQGNTWGAYQCYGDPDWRWRGDAAEDDDDAEPGGEMASPAALVQRLETLEARAQRRGTSANSLRPAVQSLAQRHGAAWGGIGVVAQAFGAAFGALGDDDAAIRWYQTAVAADDGSVTFSAVERLAHHLLLRGERNERPAEGLRDIEAAVGQLNRLTAFQLTTGRALALGLALSRKSLAEGRAGRRSAAVESLRQALGNFEKAQSLAGPERPLAAFEAGMNWIAVELRLAFVQERLPKIEGGRFDELSRILESQQAGPDWDPQIRRIELLLFRALAHGSLQGSSATLFLRLGEASATPSGSRPTERLLDTARFVLDPYREMATGAEAQIASQLLERLDALVKGNREAEGLPMALSAAVDQA